MTVLEPTIANLAAIHVLALPTHPDAPASNFVEAFVMGATHYDLSVVVAQPREWAPANVDAFRRELACRHAPDPNAVVLADDDNCICINCAQPAHVHDDVFGSCPERPDDAA